MLDPTQLATVSHPIPHPAIMSLVPSIADHFASPIATFALRFSLTCFALLATVPAHAQGESQQPEKVVELSPFVVSETEDEGYRAANTLAGSRMNAPLFITPAAISVLTKQLLDDLGAETTEDFLSFAVNADRSFGDDPTGLKVQQQDLEIMVRGFTGVSATRDYFPLGTLSSDRYNIERVDLNRGPNSILYGVGGPGGVLNTSTKQAFLDGRKKTASITVGSYNKKRAEVDLAFPLIKDRLALRVNSLFEDSEGWREFQHMKQKAVALAATYKVFKNTRIRLNVEHNDRAQNVPFIFPVKDLGASEWIAAGRPMGGNPLLPGTNPSPSTLTTANLNNILYAPQLRDQPFRLSTTGADMRPDLAGNQPTGFWTTLPGPASPVSGLVDDINFDNVPENANLMGPGNTTDQDYWAGTIVLEQRIGNLFFELAHNKREWDRDIRLVVGWAGNGVRGDANPVLPGAYYADGDVDSRNGQNPGTLLPDIGATNPQAGGLYVESQSSNRILKGGEDNFRASVAYELDAAKRNPWLGRHSIAGVWQRNDGWTHNILTREFNGTPQNNDPIDVAHNQIVRRTYLDFQSPDGQRGAMDPWANPVPTSSGVTPEWHIAFPGGLRSSVEDSALVGIQSRFWKDRLTFTGGYRRDKLRSNAATVGGIPLPNSNALWSKMHDTFVPENEELFTGDTKTFGVVVAPLKWLGFSYNQADSVQPQTAFDMVGQLIGTRQGRGEDIGIRLNLFKGRLYATANRYETSDDNQVYSPAFVQGAATPIDAVLQTLLMENLPLPAKFADAGVTEWWTAGRDRRDSKGNGIEVEVVGKLTRNWNVSLNYSRTNLEVSNVAADLNQFVRDVQGDWAGNPRLLTSTPAAVANYVRTRDQTPGRDFELEPATINDAYERVAEIAGVANRENGQEPLLHVSDSFNVFTSYRFGAQSPSLLKNGRLGLGGTYRGPAIIGYDDTQNNKPIRGTSNFTASLMVGKTFPLKNRRSIDLQLNVYNLLGNEDLRPYSATATGEVVRWMFPRTRQSFNLRVGYNF